MEDTGYYDSGESESCEEVVSAAKLAGETGGVSCSSMHYSEFNALALMFILCSIFFRYGW